MLKKKEIRYKIFFAILPIVFVVGLLAYANLWSISTTERVSRQLTNEEVPRSQALSDIKIGSLRTALAILNVQSVAANTGESASLETTKAAKVKFDLLASIEAMNNGKEQYRRLFPPRRQSTRRICYRPFTDSECYY